MKHLSYFVRMYILFLLLGLAFLLVGAITINVLAGLSLTEFILPDANYCKLIAELLAGIAVIPAYAITWVMKSNSKSIA